MFYWLMNRIAVTNLLTISLITPPLAVAIGWFAAGETISRWAILGALFVLAGIALILWKSRSAGKRNERAKGEPSCGVRRRLALTRCLTSGALHAKRLQKDRLFFLASFSGEKPTRQLLPSSDLRAILSAFLPRAFSILRSRRRSDNSRAQSDGRNTCGKPPACFPAFWRRRESRPAHFSSPAFCFQMRPTSFKRDRRHHRSRPGAEIFRGEIFAADFAQVIVHVLRGDVARFALVIHVLKDSCPGRSAVCGSLLPARGSSTSSFVHDAALAAKTETDLRAFHVDMPVPHGR